MNTDEIKYGTFKLEDKVIQITIDSQFIKRYYESIISDGAERLEKVNDELREKLDLILCPKNDGILEFIDEKKYYDVTEQPKSFKEIPKNNIELKHAEIYSDKEQDELRKLNRIFAILRNRIQSQYVQGLIEFIRILQSTILICDTTINFPHLILDTLRVRTDQGDLVDDVDGKYNSNINEIILKDEDPYMHELLHAASTRKHKKEGTIVGFYYVDKGVGVGINEFVTQFFATKLFHKGEGYFSIDDYIIVERLVNIIGFSELLKCYLETGLDGLFEQLSFTDRENSLKLVALLDDYFNISIDRRNPRTDINYNGGENLLSTIKEINSTFHVIEEDFKRTHRKTV